MTLQLQPPIHLDLVGAARFQQDIERAIVSQKQVASLWIVNLAGVKRLGHAGVRLLLSLRRLAQKRRCRLVLQSPSSTVRHVLSAALLEDYFDIEIDATALEPEDDREIAMQDPELSEIPELETENSQPFHRVVASIRAKLAESKPQGVI
jgi:anti-anti-sigma factor